MESWIGKSLSSDKAYMERAIALAKLGEGWCHPNPMVGAVIVKNGRIIGEGYHKKCGELHAERNAIQSLTEPADGATLYVTLEPCCHTGRQPPCTDAILENHIKRVVIGSRDPNPLVHGKGAAILRSHGVLVEEDFMRDACDALNPVFFHYITTRTPYIRLKWAQTLDGKIATKTGASKWITGEPARQRVQELRNASMSILAGIGTVLADDPLLTCRIPGGRNPLRIILDTHLQIPEESRLVRTAADVPLLVVCGQMTPGMEEKKAFLEKQSVEVLSLPGKDGRPDPAALAGLLGEREIDSVLVEGGGEVNWSFLSAGLADEIDVFIAPKVFGGKAKSPVGGEGLADPNHGFAFVIDHTEQIGEDLLAVCRRKEKTCLPD